MSIKLEEILNLHTVYLSHKSSQRRNLWVLWFHCKASRVALQAPWGHGPWRKGGSRGTNLRQLYWASLMTSYGSLGTRMQNKGERRAESWLSAEKPIPLHPYVNPAGHILFLAFTGATKSALSAFKSRHRLIGRLTKIDYASEFKASESAPERQPATDVLAGVYGFMWHSVGKIQ